MRLRVWIPPLAELRNDALVTFEVLDNECVACNLCVNVCPVDGCITMERLAPGTVDERTGNAVPTEHGDWTTHPNNPMARAAE